MDESRYIDITDSIISEALAKGYAQPPFDVWKDIRIKDKLNLYGRTDAIGRYFLNEKGMEYALRGCSKGIKEQMEIEKRVKALEIEIQTFSVKKQKRLYLFTAITFILSLLAYTKEYIPIIAKGLTKIIELIYN